MARKRTPKKSRVVDKPRGQIHTIAMLQVSSNSEQSATGLNPTTEAVGETLNHATPVDLGRGEAAILDLIDLPGEDARRLMELGFLPGTRISAGLSAPGGDPRVFQVDGSEIALRRETARRLRVRWPRAQGQEKPHTKRS
jgi:ferrous iron transport protein A